MTNLIFSVSLCMVHIWLLWCVLSLWVIFSASYRSSERTRYKRFCFIVFSKWISKTYRFPTYFYYFSVSKRYIYLNSVAMYYCTFDANVCSASATLHKASKLLQLIPTWRQFVQSAHLRLSDDPWKTECVLCPSRSLVPRSLHLLFLIGFQIQKN